MRSPKVSLLHIFFLLVLGSCLLAACSEWNTYSLGSNFVPANSQVRNFTHQVFVEYSADSARVWGPYLDELNVAVHNHQVSIENNSDSLALFVYGYPAKGDSIQTLETSITVKSASAYALYLNGTTLHSKRHPVILSTGLAPCYMVLPVKSKNLIYGSISVDGPLHITGRGTLQVVSTGTCLTAASLQCQYAATLDFSSAEGNGIELQGPMRSTLGTWTIDAAGNGIVSPDSIVLLNGTYQGTAIDGAFLEAAAGVLVRRSTLMAAAGWNSNILDSAYVAQQYDSVQYVWQEVVDTLSLQADTTYQVFRNDDKSATLKFTPRQSVAQPWLLLSNSALQSPDTLHFSKVKK